METEPNRMPQQAKPLFKSKETEDAFYAWLNIGGGVNPNPQDEERFHLFAYLFIKNKEDIKERRFVEECKKYTHTTRNLNRGICQTHYRRLMNIVAFMKFIEENK